MTTPSGIWNPEYHPVPWGDLGFPGSFLGPSQRRGLEPGSPLARGSEGACLKHAVSCHRGTAAAGRAQARAPPPVRLEVELRNLERGLLPRWFLVRVVSRTLHCQADPLATGGALVSPQVPRPRGAREFSWRGT